MSIRSIFNGIRNLISDTPQYYLKEQKREGQEPGICDYIQAYVELGVIIALSVASMFLLAYAIRELILRIRFEGVPVGILLIIAITCWIFYISTERMHTKKVRTRIGNTVFTVSPLVQLTLISVVSLAVSLVFLYFALQPMMDVQLSKFSAHLAVATLFLTVLFVFYLCIVIVQVFWNMLRVVNNEASMIVGYDIVNRPFLWRLGIDFKAESWLYRKLAAIHHRTCKKT